MVPQKTSTTLNGIFLTDFINPLNPASTNIVHFSIIANTKSVFSPLVSLVSVSQAVINSLTNTSIKIEMVSDPLPLTQAEKAVYFNPFTSFLVAIVFSIALAYKYSSLISQLVKERTSKCKHQQIISGMGITSYWIGNFLFDFASYVCFAALTIGICKVFNINQLIKGEAFTVTLYVFSSYGFSQLLFTYVCSFVFKAAGTAQALFYFFNFALGAMFPVIVLIFRYIGGTLSKVGIGLAWGFRLIPTYAFGETLINLQSISTLSQLEGMNYSPFDPAISL